ncbi:5-carboxymethyl-2-hydroxymuconate Delta-isomerase [Streptomyces sp. NPDC001068]|uniref:5-carboxymethyl-2-hydroxymuconate Delta-isomerase n=1 Tax=Streptomyces sp. NPDC001068 TaxID=3364544 RepID=UPI00367CA4A5
MPQITVDYSAAADPVFDREGFARALHSAVVEIAAARPEACKTLFRAADATVFGHGTEAAHVVVHVTFGLLAGRTDETKSRLTETTLDLLREHLKPEGFTLHASAEVRDLDPSYRKYEG